MLHIIEFLLPPLVASVILVGIHGYFGLHVLSRGVIFVDISMAQIAALGTLVGMLAGANPHGGLSYVFSLGFVLLAAAVFSLVDLQGRQIPKEAIIGIVYGLSLAVALIIADRATGGVAYIKESFSGGLLWVSWGKIISSAAVYSAVGLIHYRYHDRFFALSAGENGAKIPNAAFWDFFFYATFGLVLVNSVRIGGVFVVFALLVVPASIAVLFYTSWRDRIIFGWIVGVAVIILSVVFSYRYDLPNGPIIVCLLGHYLARAAAGPWVAGRLRKSFAAGERQEGTDG
ncbi:MAG: metal ABC transporter permease [Candidatus Glassbacteria bacterium]